MLWKGLVHRAFTIAFLIAVSTAQDNNDQAGHIPSQASLIFNPEEIIVDPGEPLYLDCGVEGEYKHCMWEQGDPGVTTIQVEDVGIGHYNGVSQPQNLKGNECGIVIEATSLEQNGEWACKVFVVGNVLTESKKVTVTVRPQQPLLSVPDSPFAEDEEKTAECRVAAARPAARIRWIIGTEDVTSHSESDVKPIDEEEIMETKSTFTYKFKPTEDKKHLKCVVEHRTLDEPEYAEVPLDVRFQPYAINAPQIYGIMPINNEYEIKYNFTSNPAPELMWTIEDMQLPVPAENGRYTATIKTLIDNIYQATLRIKDFSDADLVLTYKLFARNELGEKTFDISLSTGPAPPDVFGTGTIIAIVVILVVIIVVTLLILLMKYRQMYCFGDKDRVTNHLKEEETLKEEHDTESASKEPAEPKKSSAANLLKNIKSKFPAIPSRRAQKEPRLDKLEEGEKDQSESKEEKGTTNPEVVYAELELTKSSKKPEVKTIDSSSEYAEIVGTQVPDNKEIKE